jgi:hypothetical protein
MTIPVYSSNLMTGYRETGTLSETVGPGTLWVVRSINTVHYSTDGATTAGFLGYLGAYFWYATYASGASAFAQWNGRVVLPTGSTLKVVITGTLDFTIAGYILTLP